MGQAAGLLQVYHNDVWGTVCDDYFENNNNGAQVACRQLGLPFTEATTYNAEGSGTIWMDGVDCTGDEDSIENCTRNEWGDHNCSHGEDVGIICQGEGAAVGGWTVGNVRLVPDRDDLAGSYAGRLEVYHEGEWGTVCDDVFDYDNNGPQVVCRQLGLPWTNASQYDSNGPESMRTWLDDLQCTGTELSIENCAGNAWGDENCSHGEDVGILCEGSEDVWTPGEPYTNGNIRLVNDREDFAG